MSAILEAVVYSMVDELEREMLVSTQADLVSVHQPVPATHLYAHLEFVPSSLQVTLTIGNHSVSKFADGSGLSRRQAISEAVYFALKDLKGRL